MDHDSGNTKGQSLPRRADGSELPGFGGRRLKFLATGLETGWASPQTAAADGGNPGRRQARCPAGPKLDRAKPMNKPINPGILRNGGRLLSGVPVSPLFPRVRTPEADRAVGGRLERALAASGPRGNDGTEPVRSADSPPAPAGGGRTSISNRDDGGRPSACDPSEGTREP